MNAPMEKALLTLRPDLSLQLAIGATAHDVQLDVSMAYQLALMLLAQLEELRPWQGRDDAQVLERMHGLAFAATRFTSLGLTWPALSTDKQALIARTLEQAVTAVTLLEMVAATLPREEIQE